MTKAQIKDIGVFTAKIYEARAITKEHYGAIKRWRMPYFFRSYRMSVGSEPSLRQEPMLSARSAKRGQKENISVSWVFSTSVRRVHKIGHSHCAHFCALPEGFGSGLRPGGGGRIGRGSAETT